MARPGGWTALAIAVLLLAAPCRAATLPAPGRPYAGVHAALLAAGFKPFRVLVPGSDAYHTRIYDRSDVWRRFKEVAGCAGTGAGDCEFILARGSADILLVHTVGETVPGLVVKDARRLSAAQADAFYR